MPAGFDPDGPGAVAGRRGALERPPRAHPREALPVEQWTPSAHHVLASQSAGGAARE